MDGETLDVLLIEDNPGDVRLIEEMLDESGGRATAPPSRTAAATTALRHAARLEEGLRILDDGAVDVVLLDLGLPDSTGIDTLETVRDRSQAVPVVVLTGLDDERVGDRAVQRGAQEYLVKDELSPALLRRSLRHAVERRSFQRTQTALHRASRDVIAAESKPEACRLVLDAAADALDRSGLALFLFDDSTNLLRPAAATDDVEDLFDVDPTFGPDDTALTWRSFITGETISLDDGRDPDGADRREAGVESGVWIPLGDHGVLALVSDAVDGVDRQTALLADHLAATTEAALDRVEREETLNDHRRELTQQNRRLEELDRMNELIREIDQVLVQATTRDAIERAVCERLCQDDRFAFAWIGEVAGDRIAPRTWAGDDRGYLDAISLTFDDGEGPPSMTAAADESVSTVPNVATNLRDAPWRKAALARNLGSVVSVPLTYGELSYGVLSVFATEPGTFDDRSTDTFAELGETIANAINAVEARRALLTGTVVELELEIREVDDLLGRLARGVGCEIEYDGVVPQAEETVRLFFTASGAPPDSVQALVEEMPSVQRIEYIGAADGGGEGGRFEATVTGATIPSLLVEYGAIARSLRVTERAARLVVELPGDADVRAFVDWFEGFFPDTNLLARRDRERTDHSRQAFGATLAERLTDRQLEALQTAYHSGYFEWPRDRTGQEVAESLGITQPTFNGHLRAAERKLCSMLFGDDRSAGT